MFKLTNVCILIPFICIIAHIRSALSYSNNNVIVFLVMVCWCRAMEINDELVVDLSFKIISRENKSKKKHFASHFLFSAIQKKVWRKQR